MSPGIRDYWIFLKELLDGSRTRAELEASRWREERLARWLETPPPHRVLDLASGRLQPQYQILKAQGHGVIGIDLAYQDRGTLIDHAYRFARWLYRLRVPKIADRPSAAAALVCGDVTQIPVRAGIFDFVTSIAAFEHFLDVPGVVREIHRVLKPGGVAFCIIHHFTSLSGGHNVQLMGLPITEMPAGVDPWDHLRSRRLPFHVPLNEWRIGRYVEEFSAYFEILEKSGMGKEGEHLLTPAIRAELQDYSREELTCGAYLLVARKPALA